MPVHIASSLDVNTAPTARKNLLYRYRAINDWLEPILTRDELYFSDKEGLNDPFDLDFALSVRIDKARLRERFDEARRLAERLNRPETYQMFLPYIPFAVWKLPEEYARSVEKYFAWRREVLGSDLHNPLMVRDELRRLGGKIGVCCFSRGGDNVLMFSHYADSHRGCCLEFDCDDDEGKPSSVFPRLSFADRNDVSYQKDRSQVLYVEARLDELRTVS